MQKQRKVIEKNVERRAEIRVEQRRANLEWRRTRAEKRGLAKAGVEWSRADRVEMSRED